MTARQQTIKAYSYLRFSTPEQAAGDSFRRQTTMAQAYALQHGLTLDDSLSFHDLGVSAFRGNNAEVGRLAEFREAVQSGRVEQGSYLLVESLDRISRMAPRKALRVLEEVIELGITVVTLTDGRVFTAKTIDSDPMALIMAILTFMRSNEESETKSRRLKQAWVGKREKAVESGLKLTSITPAWLKLNEGRDGFIVIEDRAEMVRSMFQQIAAGAGLVGIAKDLNLRGVPVWGRGQQWHRSYIQKIRDSAAVVGRLIPHQTSHANGVKGRLALDPIEGYFPAIVDQSLFDQVTAMAAGWVPKAAPSGMQSILSGLAKCPACGSTMTRVSKGSQAKGGKPKLVCTRAKVGAGCQYRGVVLEQVEQALRDQIEPLLAMPPLTNESAEEAIAATRTALDALNDELEGLVRLAAMKPIRSVLDGLEAAEVERDRMKDELAGMEAAATITSHAAVRYRAENLLELLNSGSAEVARINAGLRSLFDAVIVDYTTGHLRLVWKSGAESSIVYAWVEAE
jgi:DNA invertase Pin-like site-specific DNA recombinase